MLALIVNGTASSFIFTGPLVILIVIVSVTTFPLGKVTEASIILIPKIPDIDSLEVKVV